MKRLLYFGWVDTTIVAIATPLGQGAIGIIRLSGSQVIEIINALVGNDRVWKPREATLVKLLAEDKSLLDQALVTFFEAPRSYTGEDMSEISCHGGVHLLKRVLERLISLGAYPANPGEFSQRAFLNQKLDLTQAEAVMDVISAQSDQSLKAAQNQLGGRLSEYTEKLRQDLLELLAHIEATIDFPEEDIAPEERTQWMERLRSLQKVIEQLLATAQMGKFLRDGVKTAIIGSPNVGKSSLLNNLLGYERSIVSQVPGTTRDTVEELLLLGGVYLRLIDTAGIRETSDEIEKQGVKRSLIKLSEADLILEVVDGSRGREIQLVEDNKFPQVPKVLIINKSDLEVHPDWQGIEGIKLSCLNKEGFSALEDQILTQLELGSLNQLKNQIAINVRHQDCLDRSLIALKTAQTAIEEQKSPEYVVIYLYEMSVSLGEIVGKIDAEAVLGEIFSSFCIGK